ncbi:MAG: hypothetical protein K0R65_340 [Crocinitomicaceae bacterium]|jgi:hypothetical protein|nr:hypothetical protein [Crocinitomicaceae bacterium]
MNSFLKVSSLLFILALSFSSCKKEGCIDNLAENFDNDAKDDDGSCTYARTKFMGTYSVTQSCVIGGNDDFAMTVTDGPNKNEVMINNFGGMDINIRAQVSGGNISFKEEQTGVVYEGTGYITGNTLTINYETCDAFFYPCSDPESCTMTAVK